MKIILATHNEGKVKELKELTKNLGMEILSLTDLNDYEEIIETGDTFIENANLKAVTISKKYNLPTLADDSGLEVEFLNNAPGVYSARYSGMGDLENNRKLLDNLKGVEDRKARFISVISYVLPDGTIKNYTGTWNGTIHTEMIGTNGFGYDSVFIPEGYEITAAQMNQELKNKLSHRAKALEQFTKDLKDK